MFTVLQRVSEASVSVEGRKIGQIEQGLLVLLCAEHGDDETIADAVLSKILKLRIFSDEDGRMNKSVQDINGGLLIVSQFTLAADTRKGNRPSFTGAAPAELGRELYDYFVTQARSIHSDVAAGEFAANMQVHLINDGPVTIPLRMTAPAS